MDARGSSSSNYDQQTNETATRLGSIQLTDSDLVQTPASDHPSDSSMNANSSFASSSELNRKEAPARVLLTQHQLSVLENEFHITRYPDIFRREVLAVDLNLPESRIQDWFRNRRSECRNIVITDTLQQRHAQMSKDSQR